MKFLFDFFPLLLFFATFKFYGIYMATIAAIVGSFLQVGYFWIKNRRFETMHLVTLAILVVMGGLTLFLKDVRFLKWKPTIVNWLFTAIIFASYFFSKTTVIEKLLGEQIKLDKKVWHQINISWGIFFLICGFLNLYMAFYFGGDSISEEERTEIWVNFKVFGLLGLTLIFAIVQSLMIARHIQDSEEI